MTFWLLLVLAASLTVAALFMRDSYGISGGGVMSLVLFGLCTLSLVVWKASLHYDRAACVQWERKTGRDTRFAYYTPFKWQCLTQAHDGKWVPIDQIGDYNK